MSGFTLAGVAALQSGFQADADEHAMLDGKQRKLKLMEMMHQAPIMPGIIPITAGAGTLNVGELTGPPTGHYWSVRRLSVYGFTAGTVIVTKNSALGNQLVPFSSAGTSTFGRGELLLRTDEFMVFIASGITLGTNPLTNTVQPGVVVDGDADYFPAWLLPDYLM